VKIRRALVSVHDKTGVVELARSLHALGVELLSTGGTAAVLRQAGLPVREVSEVTEVPELLDGRVKTLHPRIHGGILARRDRPEDLAALERYGIPPIDLVVVTLYPFEAAASRTGAAPPEVLEQIDIGGPAMIRAAAKNHGSVAVLTDPAQYAAVVAELEANGGQLSGLTRARLAREAFARTAAYDAAIARYFEETVAPDPPAASAEARALPERMVVALERAHALRYGENPHQAAAFYRPAGGPPCALGALRQLHGPELGYNNLLDISAALGLLAEFDGPAAVVVKHTNPCGAGLGATVAEALARARASDPVSIYGGIVGVNRRLDLAGVEALSGVFLEVLFAPAFAPDALETLQRTRKKCRVLEIPDLRDPGAAGRRELRSVPGGLLVQTPDTVDLDETALRTVSRRPPTADEMAALRLAWRVVKHVKSNAIVLAVRDQVIGVGAGQMNRVDAARLAVMRARDAGFTTAGSVCASDAFFPFRDGLDTVAAAGVTAVIQPGGSLRDAEVIAAADEHGMAMVFTGLRHFRH
jgi:phosphoribosylaminoimidazolecarboxamide formyltransferase/IMP cyclohydrolase